ncbi:MAG: 2TM domain-containing protein [Acidimicrobiia bacterium]|nr:2TM domain-containing protein [Acidimicrobiia bacterium]
MKRLKAKRDVRNHLFVYVAVNTLLVAIWAFTGADFFWPIFSIVFWGFGVVMHAWGVYGGSKPIGEAEVQREMERMSDDDIGE